MNAPAHLPLPPSLYADTAVAPTPTPPLDADKNVSVAIIGGGFTGLSTALHLAEQGVDVTVLEAQQPGWGASGNNGGQVNPGLKHDPDQIEADFGTELGRPHDRVCLWHHQLHVRPDPPLPDPLRGAAERHAARGLQ